MTAQGKAASCALVCIEEVFDRRQQQDAHLMFFLGKNTSILRLAHALRYVA